MGSVPQVQIRVPPFARFGSPPFAKFSDRAKFLPFVAALKLVQNRELKSYQLGRIKDASKKVAQRRNLKLVLDSDLVVFSSDELDITDDILSYLNADG